MTVQDVLSQTPYKDELENLNSKAIDFNNSVKEINKAKGGEEKDKKIREAKSAHAAYQYQSGIVHDLTNRLANGKDLDHNVAHRASQEYNKAAYAADASVQKTIENQNLILQEDVSADYLEIKDQKTVDMRKIRQKYYGEINDHSIDGCMQVQLNCIDDVDKLIKFCNK